MFEWDSRSRQSPLRQGFRWLVCSSTTRLGGKRSRQELHSVPISLLIRSACFYLSVFSHLLGYGRRPAETRPPWSSATCHPWVVGRECRYAKSGRTGFEDLSRSVRIECSAKLRGRVHRGSDADAEPKNTRRLREDKRCKLSAERLRRYVRPKLPCVHRTKKPSEFFPL